MRLRKVIHRLKVIREKLAERNGLQRWIARKVLPLAQSFGFSITGDHFYETIPNLKLIREQYKEEPRKLLGFVVSPFWIENMERVVEPYLSEYLTGPAFLKYGRKNWFYNGWDAAYYYCLIRHRKPQLITEIGRGISTRIASEALILNAAEGDPCEIVSIDPYFRGDNTINNIRIITAELQKISSSERESLLKADILFVDSSHVVKWGSDVLQLFESWIPSVAVKTLVHIHDIFTPYDYPRTWLVEQKRFWNEQYIFESFAAFNNSFQIECPLFYLFKTGALKELAEKLNAPALIATDGSAIWLKRIQ